jgi:hypothetical protein
MPRLSDTAVAEGLQRLPGWERLGNHVVKTFTRAGFAHLRVLSTRLPQRPRRPPARPTAILLLISRPTVL